MAARRRIEEADGPLERAFEIVRGSILLRMAVGGVLLIVLGYLIQNGVWAAMFPAWGTALVLIGVLGYAIVRWQRR